MQSPEQIIGGLSP